MKSYIPIAILAASAATVATPAAAEPRSAYELLNMCDPIMAAMQKEPITDEMQHRGFRCMGYMEAIVDNTLFWQAATGKNQVCPPTEGLKVGPMVLALLDYVGAHPEKGSESARTVMPYAMKVKWPCK